MKTIDRELFVRTGREGGKASGAVKRRGGKRHYAALGAKGAKARWGGKPRPLKAGEELPMKDPPLDEGRVAVPRRAARASGRGRGSR